MPKEALFHEALKAYQIRQFDQAYLLFSKLLKSKDPDVYYYLGLLYKDGKGIKQNEKEAFRLFSLAQLELHPEATYEMGQCYELGTGTAKDETRAFEYYHAANARGSLEGELKVAKCYETGFGTTKNQTLALQTYVSLAKKDHPYAMYKIGMAYLQGDGVRKNIESAHSWLNKALINGSLDAMNQFRLMGTRSKTDHRETHDLFQIAKELLNSNREQEALIYFTICAQEGNVDAYVYLSEQMKSTDHSKETLKKSFEYMLKAAKENHPYALFQIAKKYELGEGTPSSYLLAEKYYLASYQAGYTLAKQELESLRGYPYA